MGNKKNRPTSTSITLAGSITGREPVESNEPIQSQEPINLDKPMRCNELVSNSEPVKSSDMVENNELVKSSNTVKAIEPMIGRAMEVAALLKVLANEHRLLILCALLSGSMTVTEINEAVSEISQSALSQHLARLKTLGLLSSHKKGQYVHYEICDHRVERVLAVLKDEYCSS